MNTEQIYKMVTDRMIAKLREGICPWKKPWHGGMSMAVNITTGKEYSFLNQMLLGFSGRYITFNQAKAKGGNIKKCSKSTPVVFWTTGYNKKEKDDDGIEKIVRMEYQMPVLKYYNVFSISDVEGIDFSEQDEYDYIPSDLEIIDKAEAVISDYSLREGLTINKDLRDGACYSPIADVVNLPC